MSTIFGKVNFSDQPINADELSAMQTKLNHWNADDAGIYNTKSAGFGHLMLYNTPESLNEKLPYHKAGTGLTITADARIDNRDELYTILDRPNGYEQLPDSTLILMAYEKYGESCVDHLIGDFAFAIWNESKQQLFCARDHMGVKPFFYFHTPAYFAFATEVKGLLIFPEAGKEIDREFLYNDILAEMGSMQEDDTTIYKNIRRLKPAHTLVINVANPALQFKMYWEPDAFKENVLATEQDYYDGLRFHLEQAVKCRLRTHHKVAVELSGGMDSTVITGMANRFLKERNQKLITISNVIPDGVTDEKTLKHGENQYIEAAVAFNGITENVYLSQPVFKSRVDEIQFCLDVNDGPQMISQLWQTPMKKAAQQKEARVLLSGFPGDEMVTYRGKFKMLEHLDHKRYLSYFKSKMKDNHGALNKFAPFMPAWFSFAGHKVKNLFKINSRRAKVAAQLFNLPISAMLNQGDFHWKNKFEQERFINYRHYQKFRLCRPHVSLRMESETRFGLFFRLEPRFPMADIRLIQFYLSMPNHLKYQGTLDRTAYRKAMHQYMPPELLERNDKHGCMNPFSLLLTQEQRKQDHERTKEVALNAYKKLKGHPLLKNVPNPDAKMASYISYKLEILLWLEQSGAK
jgi:asparagine synthase (glutamine-hydrolysing)